MQPLFKKAVSGFIATHLASRVDFDTDWFFNASIVLTSILASPKSGIKEVSENSPESPQSWGDYAHAQTVFP